MGVGHEQRSADLRQIGEVASELGLSLRTVRHYEDAGLVRPAMRSAGGFRLYDDEAISRLRLVVQMKPLGFSLEEMRLLIDARDRLSTDELTSEERVELRDRLALFSAAVEERVAALREQLAIAESFSASLGLEVRGDG